ncbi:MAG TPA: transketolase [Dehalococcoidia bacterium]|nr:transketolase [Dehalococcoidia bacterium]
MAQAQTVSIDQLQAVARRVRRHILEMTTAANSGHPGGPLSAVEIITSLYFRLMRHDPQNPSWPDRDRFIMSKGHATPVLYSVLAEAGYFPVDELMTFRRLGSRLQGHTVMGNPPGIEMSAGALGMGLSFSLGQALAGRLDGRGYQVFCLLSDGDSQEGQTWEAIMAAAHHKADNLTAIVDRNHIQNDGFSDYDRYPGGDPNGASIPGGWVMADGHTANIMTLDPLEKKYQAFGWNTISVPDGHDFAALIAALEEARGHKGQPTAVICETTKGKGVSFMENNPDYHGKAATPEQLEQALQELKD